MNARRKEVHEKEEMRAIKRKDGAIKRNKEGSMETKIKEEERKEGRMEGGDEEKKDKEDGNKSRQREKYT